MIDLDDFEYEIKLVPDNECALVTKDEAFELINRLRQAERDAARYVWLREKSIFARGCSPLVYFTDINGDAIEYKSICCVLSHDELDESIDEAMQ